MWDYELASEILYEFFYGEVEIEDYDEIIDSLTKFLEFSLQNDYKKSNILDVAYKKVQIQNYLQHIKGILRVQENLEVCVESSLNTQVPDMFIFNDGEVHFNDCIQSANSIYRYLDPSDMMELPATSEITLYRDNQKLKYSKLIICPDFISTGYGEDKLHILPGDWLIFANNNVYPCNFKSALKNGVYGYQSIPTQLKYQVYPETLFKREMIEAAAKWYAGFLPGIPEDCVTQIPDETKIAKYDRLNATPVSDFEYQNFITALVEEIYLCVFEHYKAEIFSITLGDIRCSGYPDQIDKALHSSRIEIKDGLYIFPYRSEVKIYSNGLVNFNNKVIYAHPSLNLYSFDKMDLTDAPLMVFKGGDFKVLKIDTTALKGMLYSHSVIHGVCEIAINSKFLYVSLRDEYFKGDKKLKDYSDSELIEILQNPLVFKETFEIHTISYETSLRANLLTYANDLGEVKPQAMRNGWYQYRTKPARVVKIEKEGVINKLGPISLYPGDFLLAYGEINDLHFYSASSTMCKYAGYLCDETGNVIDHNPHFPGHPEIPLLGSETSEAA